MPFGIMTEHTRGPEGIVEFVAHDQLTGLAHKSMHVGMTPESTLLC